MQKPVKILRYKVKAHVTWTDRDNHRDDIVYFLYENRRTGVRSFDVICTGYTNIYRRELEHPMYYNVVKPWLDHANVEHILKEYEVTEDRFRELIVPKYTETLIDRIYNWYCQLKGRSLRELTHQDYHRLLIDD